MQKHDQNSRKNGKWHNRFLKWGTTGLIADPLTSMFHKNFKTPLITGLDGDIPTCVVITVKDTD